MFQPLIVVLIPWHWEIIGNSIIVIKLPFNCVLSQLSEVLFVQHYTVCRCDVNFHNNLIFNTLRGAENNYKCIMIYSFVRREIILKLNSLNQKLYWFDKNMIKSSYHMQVKVAIYTCKERMVYGEDHYLENVYNTTTIFIVFK